MNPGWLAAPGDSHCWALLLPSAHGYDTNTNTLSETDQQPSLQLRYWTF
jgi:hypothetical protein